MSGVLERTREPIQRGERLWSVTGRLESSSGRDPRRVMGQGRLDWNSGGPNQSPRKSRSKTNTVRD